MTPNTKVRLLTVDGNPTEWELIHAVDAYLASKEQTDE